MDKLKMHSPNLVDVNIEKISALFPNCITETNDENGELKKAVDFDLLKQELSQVLVDGEQERYRLDWVGKKEAILTANAPIAKTLRPCHEESINFDKTENLFIEGDNLEALKLLQENYLGKVKMIYIDPPYNTGNDFIYEDDFAESTESFFEKSNQVDEEGNRLIANTESNGRFHSDWLSMMYSRLKLARNLLSDDGVTVVSIDESEFSNLIKIMNEIFGEDNYCGEIIWKNSSKNDQRYISIQHEYLVVYVKNKNNNSGEWLEKKQGLDEIYKEFEKLKKKHGEDWLAIHKEAQNWFKQFPESNPIYASKHYSWMDERGVYFPDNISGPNDGQYVYDVFHPITHLKCKMPRTGWRYPESKIKKLIEENYIHFGVDHTTVPNKKTYLFNTEFQSLTSIKVLDGRAASSRLKALFDDVKVFTNPKDENLLADLISAFGLKDDDIVLDFFAGSATTAEAVVRFNMATKNHLKFIIVQLPEALDRTLKSVSGSSKKTISDAIKFLQDLKCRTVVSELSKERIRRVGKKILEDNTNKEGIENLDIGFRVLKIDSSNMKDVYYTPDALKQADMLDLATNIKEDRTSEDLLFQVMLDWGLELSLSIERKTVAGKEVFFVAGNSLVACFDELTFEVVDEVAKDLPLRFVSAESSIHLDHDKTNIKERFKQLSPDTEVKFL